MSAESSTAVDNPPPQKKAKTEKVEDNIDEDIVSSHTGSVMELCDLLGVDKDQAATEFQVFKNLSHPGLTTIDTSKVRVFQGEYSANPIQADNVQLFLFIHYFPFPL